MTEQLYSYTRTCPECEGSGTDDLAMPDGHLYRSNTVCARCDGDGVIDVYVDSEDELPAILLAPEGWP